MTEAEAGAAATPQPGRAGPLSAIPAGRLWLAASLLLLLLVLALAAWLEWGRHPPVVERILPAPPAELSAEVQARAALLAREIDALAGEVAVARHAVLSFACPPGQRLRQGALPRPLDSAVVPVAIPAELAALGSGALAERLERATALVVAEGSVGTGFFVAPTLLLTNRHVVDGMADGSTAGGSTAGGSTAGGGAAGARVFITSRSLGGAREGVVLRASPPGLPGAADLALVRLLKGTAPATLGLAGQAPKLAPVVAAGYPGLTLQNDTGFRRMIGGDLHATPDLNLTQGVVQSIQESPQGVPVLVHTAAVLQGNSGGPLVDACGRAVGINSFIAVDAEQSGRVSYAQTAAAIDAFLGDSGARIPIDSRPCPQP